MHNSDGLIQWIAGLDYASLEERVLRRMHALSADSLWDSQSDGRFFPKSLMPTLNTSFREEKETTPMMDTVEGKKFDQGKPRFDLIPPFPELMIAKVFTMGAKKYGDKNWRNGLDWSRMIGAIRRHLNQFCSGEDLDKESGLPHLAHAATNCMMLMEFMACGLGKDDRDLDDEEVVADDKPSLYWNPREDIISPISQSFFGDLLKDAMKAEPVVIDDVQKEVNENAPVEAAVTQSLMEFVKEMAEDGCPPNEVDGSDCIGSCEKCWTNHAQDLMEHITS